MVQYSHKGLEGRTVEGLWIVVVEKMHVFVETSVGRMMAIEMKTREGVGCE